MSSTVHVAVGVLAHIADGGDAAAACRQSGRMPVSDERKDDGLCRPVDLPLCQPLRLLPPPNGSGCSGASQVAKQAY